ncbi:CopD family protein [Alteromonas oceanisediminis]|uniref:CopD family protein n=1 Tax=Alteromonas oceanisediminis TaxID=2836180 RepID=UPI001BD9A174|nr:CopD family protein [Alteromonas oceanisediminis]MBT0585263.1 CopD family protein [Alteromonas oceanisediminis]
MSILWLKALHVFFMLAWMAGLFYLPRLFVYHAINRNTQSSEDVHQQFKIMERRLWFFVTPFALLTLIFGIALIVSYGKAWFAASAWLHIKLLLVLAIYAYHFYLFKVLRDFAADKPMRSPLFYRILNEAPVLLIFAIVVLAIVKPV